MSITAPLAGISPRSLRDELGLSRERMSRLLDVSAKTIERWERGGRAASSRPVRERLGQLDEITTLGLLIYDAEGFRSFLSTPLPVFDGRTALQLIELGESERVLASLAADYEGLGF